MQINININKLILSNNLMAYRLGRYQCALLASAFMELALYTIYTKLPMSL